MRGPWLAGGKEEAQGPGRGHYGGRRGNGGSGLEPVWDPEGISGCGTPEVELSGWSCSGLSSGPGGPRTVR